MKYIITIGYEYYEINNYIKHCIIIDVRNARKNVINIEYQTWNNLYTKSCNIYLLILFQLFPYFIILKRKKSIYLRKNRKWIILTNFKL